jgi:hypothetical protein
MAPSEDKSSLPDERARKPYVAPKVILSELYAKGVMKDHAYGTTPEQHTHTSSSTS